MTAWVCDYAWGGPPVNQIRDNYVAVIRYLSGGSSGKDWTRGQIDALHAAGVGVGAVWETTANRAAAGGQAGRVDGVRANAQADRLGFPREVPLYAAVDFDAQNMGPIVDYFAAFGSAGPRFVSPYGSANTIEAVCGSGRPKITAKGWQTVAWSRGRLSPRAAMLQLVARPVPGVSGDHDDNRVIDLSAVAAWFPGVQPAPQPPRPPFVPHPPIFHDHPEENTPMQTVDIQIPTDAAGNGYTDVKVPNEKVLPVKLNGKDPSQGGYPPGMNAYTFAVGGQTRVEVVNGPINGHVDATLFVIA